MKGFANNRPVGRGLVLGMSPLALLTLSACGNDAPTVANAIVDQTISEDSVLLFQFNSNVFADVDAGDSFTYTATLSDGSALPSWLAFNAATRTFSGTPLNGDVGVIAVKVTATDSSSAAVTDTFNVTVTNTNDAPIITSTANTSATEGYAYSYTFTASDVDTIDTLSYSNSTLPMWLDVNGGVKTFHWGGVKVGHLGARAFDRVALI